MNYVGDTGVNTVSINGGTSVQTGDAGSSVYMNVPAGNGTFTTAASARNTGTGVVDAGSVTDAATWAAAATATPAGPPYTITFTDATDYSVTDASGNPVTTGTYDSTSGGEISFNGVEVGISGAPAAGDSFTVSPAGQQSVFDTLDNLVNSLNNAGSSAAARAQLSSQLASGLSNIDQALGQVSTVTSNVGSRISLISSVSNDLTAATTDVTTQISNVSNLDYAAATAQYSQEYIALQAAEQSYADINKLSLFNYL
jgi:flagellar hook-associated protein 3 FlgL